MAGVAIVGSGWGINVQLPCFRQAGLKVAALVGRDASRSAELAAKHDVPFSSSSLTDALARPDVTIVAIATPPATHAAFTTEALRAGKHVVTEKPFAMDVGEARSMAAAHREACAQLGRPLLAVLDHELRFHSSVQQVKQFIAAGSFGRITAVHATFIGGMQPALSDRFAWWNDAKAFGGVLGAIGSHYVDLVSYLTSSEAVRAAADLRSLIAEKLDESGASHVVTGDDHSVLRTEHVSNPASTRASYRGVADHPQRFHVTTTLVASAMGVSRSELLLLSDRGCIAIDLATLDAEFTPADRANPRGLPDAQKQTWESDAPAAHIPSPYVSGTVLLGQRLAQAIEQIKDGAVSGADLSAFPPSLAGVAASFDDGVYVQAVLDAARESSRKYNGGWIDVKHD